MNIPPNPVKLLCLTAVLTGTISLPATAQTPPVSVAQFQVNSNTSFTQGLTNLQRQDYQGAITSFTQTINNLRFNNQRGQDTDPAPYINRGIAYQALGDYEAAMADYQRSLQIDDKDPCIYLNQGVIYYEQRQYGLAVTNFDKARRYSGREPRFKSVKAAALVGLGDIYQLSENPNYLASAIAKYQEAIKLEPRNIAAYLNKATVHFRLKDYKQANLDYNQVIIINPSLVDGYNNRAAVRFVLGRYGDALADLNKVIQLQPDNPDAYYNRGLIYNQLQDRDRAIADFERAKQLYEQLGEVGKKLQAVNTNLSKLQASSMQSQ